MDTKKLRQKILDLAIRGKLESQNPNDEPASALLNRIPHLPHFAKTTSETSTLAAAIPLLLFSLLRTRI